MSQRNSNTYNVVLGGIIAALSVVFMLMTMLIPVGELVFPALAGLLLIVTVFEIGEKWSFLIYVVVSLLSLVLLPDKSAAIYYIFFLGYYPIVKSFIERIKNKPFKIALKFIIFNIAIVVSALIVMFVLNVDTFKQAYWYAIYAAILNVTFFVYDIALDRIIVMYGSKWRRLIHKSSKY